MKLITKSLLLAAALAPAALLAQGTLNFQNIVPSSGINAPVYDADGKTLLAGSAFLAQLFAGPDAATLAPVGATAIFRTGAGAGYWDPAPNALRTISTVAPGAVAAVQVRVWESAKGSTYDRALAAGSKVGSSATLKITLGGAGSPPSLPANLTGLASFSLGAAKEVPLIVQQPVGHVVKEGNSVTFAVQAKSSTVLTYQWQKQATTNSWTNIVGATNATLELKSVVKADSGAYRVEVSNSSSTVDSQAAILKVVSQPGFAKGHLKHHPDGKFELGLDGDTDVTYRIEASTNLVDWVVIATIKGTGGELPIIDSEAVAHTHRFYRIIVVDETPAALLGKVHARGRDDEAQD